MSLKKDAKAAVDELVDLSRSDDPSVAMKAVRALLERSHGPVESDDDPNAYDSWGEDA